MKRCYNELIRLPTFADRLKYLQTSQLIGERTFGGDRYINQRFYSSKEWRDLRYKIMLRDNGYDLAMDGYPVGDRPRIHHINPITIDQLKHGDDSIFSFENLILCSYDTHQAIHYGNEKSIPQPLTERKPYDTCPWKTNKA